MNDTLLLKKLNNGSAGVIEFLDAKKSKRMGGVKTNYIPAVEEVADAIKSIPKGKTKTINELRQELAKIANTDTACPAKILKYWKWMANLSDEMKLDYKGFDIPWWRVLKAGRPSRHMPGGVERQKNILGSEGVVIS